MRKGKDKDTMLLLGLGLGALYLSSRGSGGSGGAAPEEKLVAPTTTPLASTTIEGWLWPAPTIALATDGVRTDARGALTVECAPVISQGMRLPDHEGVDICYRRPGGNLPSLIKSAPFDSGDRVVKAVRPGLYRTIDEWLATLKGNERQKWAAGYLPGQTIGGSSKPGGATPGEWQDSRNGTRGHFGPPRILLRSVAAGRLWASGDSARGHWVLIDHGPYTTWYGHLSSLSVPEAANGKVKGTNTVMQLPRGTGIGVMGYDPSAPRTVIHLHLQCATYPAGVRRIFDPSASLARAERWPA